MFVYSVRASTIKFFSVIVLSLVILGALLFVGGGAGSVYASSSPVDFSGIKTNEDRIAFISQFNLGTVGEAFDSEEFRMPENFDKVIAGYNEIQKKQGLDLTKYKNKRVTRYTYEITGYEGSSDTVYVNLLVYRNTVIGCDLSSPNPNGFVIPLVKLG